MITVIGLDTYGILKSLVSPADPSTKTFEELTATLRLHFAPKRNIIAERFKFYKREQRPAESLADFIVQIKALAQSCDFGSFLPNALREKLVCGIRNTHIQT